MAVGKTNKTYDAVQAEQGAVSKSYDETSRKASATLRKTSRSKKSSAAFRTISEVADELGVQQHVLRFWETKFSQIKPLKRGGGRRYYRPEDVDLLKAINRLLYVEGYTIKGVQKLLRDAGKKQIVSTFSADADQDDVIRGPLSGQQESTGSDGEKASGLSVSQRKSLEAVLDELKDLRGMIKAKR